MIKDTEIQLVRKVLDMARESGAAKARATLSRSSEDLVATLNGEVDRITHCFDSSLSISLFVDGRFGSFSTNKLDEEALESFIVKAVDTVRMLAPDECRDIPSHDRCCSTAVTGDELGIVDPGRDDVTPDMRRETALAASVFGSEVDPGIRIISEEGEYSDSSYDTVVMDSEGLCCLHSETSFDYGVEVTIESGGDRYSGYGWDSSSKAGGIAPRACGLEALRRACGQIGSEPAASGKYNLVIDREVASKVVSPILRALNAYSLQQNNSFLMDSLGKRIFPEGMTVMDLPHIRGQVCSKLFDSEGVSTVEGPIIENGVVRQYFVNTYMSRKMDMAPTVEDATRPAVMPWPKAGLDRDDIMKICGSGILVTDFNGGNSNSATGDFSYGIEGFLFEDGKIVRPVSEMLITGNFLTLWGSLIAAGDDPRPCMSKLIPTLAFSNVDFSG